MGPEPREFGEYQTLSDVCLAIYRSLTLWSRRLVNGVFALKGYCQRVGFDTSSISLLALTAEGTR